jgi:flagella basal body P-ring formation protein FlgA
MMFLGQFALGACLALPAGAANVTAADIHLDGVPPETVLSFAPAPGIPRVFDVAELKRIAARFPSAVVPEENICVERVMAPLDPVKLLAAMQTVVPDAKIEILEYSKQPAPEGEMEFRRTGLRGNGAGSYWYGVIRYAPHREFTIWAKVNVTVRQPRVIALSDLLPGKPISNGQIKFEVSDVFPSQQPMAERVEDVAGRYPRAIIRAGAPVRSDALEPPRDVRQGETVSVDVISGGMRLQLTGHAESSGSIGDTITVQNPTSQKKFQAKIEAKGRVSVEVSK